MSYKEEETNEIEEEKNRIEAFKELDINNIQFFIMNLKSRYILTNSVIFSSLYNPRYKKIILIITQFAIEIAIITFCFTYDMTPDVSFINNDYVFVESGLMIFYAFLAALISNAVMYLLSNFMRVKLQQRKRLYKVVQVGDDISILNEWYCLY